MLDDKNQNGIVQLSLLKLFDLIKKKEYRNVKIIMSFLEVYNETIRDLLGKEKNKNLEVQEDIAEVKVSNLCEIEVKNYEQAMLLINEGIKNRKMSFTLANKVSSRSHAILQIYVFNETLDSNMNIINYKAKLCFVDLAGSERASATSNKGERFKEGSYINQSLLALANCINSLASNKNMSKVRVKYRDSKLTHLLKNSLEGNCLVVMIANINPSRKSFQESNNTLKYAFRARNIKLSATVQKKDNNETDIEKILKKNDILQKEYHLLLDKHNKLKKFYSKVKLLFQLFKNVNACYKKKDDAFKNMSKLELKQDISIYEQLIKIKLEEITNEVNNANLNENEKKLINICDSTMGQNLDYFIHNNLNMLNEKDDISWTMLEQICSKGHILNAKGGVKVKDSFFMNNMNDSTLKNENNLIKSIDNLVGNNFKKYNHAVLDAQSNVIASNGSVNTSNGKNKTNIENVVLADGRKMSNNYNCTTTNHDNSNTKGKIKYVANVDGDFGSGTNTTTTEKNQTDKKKKDNITDVVLKIKENTNDIRNDANVFKNGVIEKKNKYMNLSKSKNMHNIFNFKKNIHASLNDDEKKEHLQTLHNNLTDMQNSILFNTINKKIEDPSELTMIKQNVKQLLMQVNLNTNDFISLIDQVNIKKSVEQYGKPTSGQANTIQSNIDTSVFKANQITTINNNNITNEATNEKYTLDNSHTSIDEKKLQEDVDKSVNADGLQDLDVNVMTNKHNEGTGVSTGMGIGTGMDTETDTGTILDTSTSKILDTSTGTILDISTSTIPDTSTGTILDTSTSTIPDTSTGTILDTSTGTIPDTSTGTAITVENTIPNTNKDQPLTNNNDEFNNNKRKLNGSIDNLKHEHNDENTVSTQK
uniref:Kinesin-like protein n=1 Tax=Piliocolobus tephrosceles TaxID=591936 RepID=A0A8C9LKH6_9PRIM